MPELRDKLIYWILLLLNPNQDPVKFFDSIGMVKTLPQNDRSFDLNMNLKFSVDTSAPRIGTVLIQ